MTLQKKDVQFSIADGAKVAKVETDSSSTLTYDTALSIDIQSASFNQEFFEAELRHNGKIRDKFAEFEKITGQFVLGEVDLDALALLMNGEVTNTGSGATEKNIFHFDPQQKPNYFGFGFRTKYSPEGTVGTKIYKLRKCKITNIDMGGGDREYSSPVVSFESIPTVNSNATFKTSPLLVEFCKGDNVEITF